MKPIRAARTMKKAKGAPSPPGAGSVVSEVRPDPAKAGCVLVRVRGHKPWRIEEADAAELGLTAGSVLGADAVVRLERAATNCRAGQKLRARLAVRALSRMEAGALLRRAGAEAGYARGVVDRFVELGWIDDARLAANVAGREAARAVGRMRVVARVARRGIDSGEARRAAEAAVSARRETPLELAMLAARTQVRKLPPGLEAEVRRRRVLGFLSRRGFDEHTAREAVAAVLGRGGQRGGD